MHSLVLKEILSCCSCMHGLYQRETHPNFCNSLTPKPSTALSSECLQMQPTGSYWVLIPIPHAPLRTSFVFHRSRSGGSSGHRGRHSSSFLGRKIFRWWLFSGGNHREGFVRSDPEHCRKLQPGQERRGANSGGNIRLCPNREPVL